MPLGSVGKELAHWYYEPYEWEYCVWGEWRRTKSELQTRCQRFAVAALVFLLAVNLPSVISPSFSLVNLLVYLFVYGLGSALAIALYYFLTYRLKRSWFRLLHKAPPEVIITNEAVIFGGMESVHKGLIKVMVPSVLVESVTLDSGDFGMLTFNPNNIIFNMGLEKVRVLIPNGKGAEAEQVTIMFQG